jgi:CrcB protein
VTRLLLVCLGGAVGSGARYLTAVWAATAFGIRFPYGTLLVNALGSFLLGFLMHSSALAELLSVNTRLALATGALGGFTTYSTFNYETTELLRAGAWWQASLNIVVTLAGCLAAGIAGVALARFMGGR